MNEHGAGTGACENVCRRAPTGWSGLEWPGVLDWCPDDRLRFAGPKLPLMLMMLASGPPKEPADAHGARSSAGL